MSRLLEKLEQEAQEADGQLEQVAAVDKTVPEPEPVVSVEEPAVEIPEPVQPVPEKTPAEDPNSETFKHRWEVLQGKYNSELGQLRNVNRLQSDQISDMREQVSELKRKLEDVTSKQDDTSAATQYLTAEERESLDPDQLSLTERLARGVADRRVKTLEERYGKLEKTLENLEIDGFWQQVESKFPGALALNGDPRRNMDPDPGFVAWLHEEDPLYGTPRLNLAERQYQARNIEGVARIFRAYKQQAVKEETPPSPASEVAPQVTPRPRRVESKPETEKRTYSLAEHRDLANRVVRLNQQGRYEQARKLEEELDTAAYEGRIR